MDQIYKIPNRSLVQIPIRYIHLNIQQALWNLESKASYSTFLAQICSSSSTSQVKSYQVTQEKKLPNGTLFL